MAEPHAAQRLHGTAQEMGRKNLLLAGTKPPNEHMNYERLPESAEAFVYAAMSHPMARRLTRG